ncbi:protein-lysine N-methyltransferase [Lachancea thermotolerans CBS 6340]|uniref:KLTH0H04004p n=1 Tax=Lachancea thermotolerans (strain ATCC 56472 / CBS 6340 / NRRL Y-8284) TaxID=559295 RepID=C5E2D3_LACTC|nr:KLTH0H04004p [Lachancea thermotolerans CBS 6340]CAR30194.1 KLTH0H04004p [Lachancea thermotolerans CBS 6340]
MQAEKLKVLLDWGLDNGVKCPDDVEFVNVGGKGFACIAKSDITEAEFIIPESLIIKSSLAVSFFKVNSNQTSWLKLLIAKLKFDKSSTTVDDENLKAKFAPYIDALPDEIDSPLVWNPSELDLLGNTNLRSSLRIKLYSIFNEWKLIMETLKKHRNEVQAEILNIEETLGQSEDHVYRNITSKVFQHSSETDWWSFPAFLWSHMMFLSRAFPEYVINPSTDPSNVVLLPIIDLLNHDYRSKVEWNQRDGAFGVRKLETVLRGEEIFNNYGGKGNEELLSGYGFVLEENIFDTVALKIQLPLTTVSEITSTTHLFLPTLSDYTTSAFELSSGKETKQMLPKKDSQYKDGVLYLLSKENDAPLRWLLDLFSFLEKSPDESCSSLRVRLQGLQNLRNAIETKLSSTSSTSDRQAAGYDIKEYRARAARIYKSGQTKALKHAVNELKRTEKEWTSQHKGDLLTAKRIMRFDPNFMESELPLLLRTNANSDITLDSYDTLIILWVACKAVFNTCPREAQWAMDAFKAYSDCRENTMASSAEGQHLYQTFFPNGSSRLGQEQFINATEFLQHFSYTRLSNGEVILVKDVNL